MKILLVSGMDFSGKTSVVRRIDDKLSSSCKIQHKYLGIDDPLKEIRNSKKKYSVKEWSTFWERIVLEDISGFNRLCTNKYYDKFDIILQDGLSAFKHLAALKADADSADINSVIMFEEAVRKYPRMDSVFLTASMEDRKKRYQMREPSKRSYSDQRLFSPLFSKIEYEYKTLVFNCLTNTLVIDTSKMSIDEVAKVICNQFLS